MNKLFRSKKELISSSLCGCYHCLKTYPPSHIEEYIDGGETAICPKCDMDSVVGTNQADSGAFKEELIKLYVLKFCYGTNAHGEEVFSLNRYNRLIKPLVGDKYLNYKED